MTMHALYLISVWIHILAATTWIGGMLFLVLVMVPWLRTADRAQAAALLHVTGLRFRRVGWSCFGVLVVTGGFNLWCRGVRLSDLGSGDWWAAPFGRAVALKLAIVALVVCVSAVHDFVVGPRATVAAAKASPEAARLRQLARGMGRLNVLLALAIVGLGIVLVRGWP